jgi:hypothetical protein
LLKNGPHQATIVSREDSLMIKIPKTEYISLLSEIERKRLADKIAFLKNFPIFDFWVNKAH